MTQEELFAVLKEKFKEILEEHDLTDEKIKVECRALTPLEAIGETKRKDFPILDGADIMLQAEFDGGIGQAFTSSPSIYQGTLREILDMDITENGYDRSLFIAALNAVMRKLGMCDCSIHCKNEGPEECAYKVVDHLMENYGKVKIAQIGYQPAILERLSERFDVRVLDLNPNNVGDIRYGVKVLDGIKDYEETVLEWADLVLCTGSTLCNGSIVNFIDIGKEVLFYGTTAAGAATLLGLKRLCFAD